MVTLPALVSFSDWRSRRSTPRVWSWLMRTTSRRRSRSRRLGGVSMLFQALLTWNWDSGSRRWTAGRMRGPQEGRGGGGGVGGGGGGGGGGVLVLWGGGGGGGGFRGFLVARGESREDAKRL